MLKISHVRTVPKSNMKVVGTEAKPIHLTHIYITTQTLLPWMKGGRVSIPFLVNRCGHASGFTCVEFTTLQRTTGDWGCLKNTDSVQKYKIKTRKSVPDFSRGHNSRDAVVAGFIFTYTIRTYNH